MEPKSTAEQGPSLEGKVPEDHAASEGPPSFTLGMEHEVFRLLGGLLGSMEALATDAQMPLEGRQRERLQQALDFGHELKDHVEAFSFLAQGDARERLTMAPYSVRRMLEHAVRSAAWQASERGVSLTLPALEAWAEHSVVVDVRALDRVIRGACEYLISVVSHGGSVDVRLSTAQGGLQVELRGDSLVQGLEPKAPSELLYAAWQRTVQLHAGEFSLDRARLRALLWLPLTSP
jgi:signal transduction histidine kinase